MKYEETKNNDNPYVHLKCNKFFENRKIKSFNLKSFPKSNLSKYFN